MSNWADVLSGVPQGLVLGLLVFVIFINDLDKGLNCRLLKFTDNTTKLFGPVSSVEEVGKIRDDFV